MDTTKLNKREWESRNLKDDELVKLINGLSEKECLDMKILSLYGNIYLTAIPPEIKRFKNLHQLGVQGNRITYSKVSDELSQLIHLRCIYFASSLLGNSLGQIPKSIFSLVDLTDITLSKCKLTYISPLISKLVNLERVYLDENYISSLPSEMIKLQRLNTLSLYSNKLPKQFMQNVYNYGLTQNFYSKKEDKVRTLIVKHMLLLKKKVLHKDIVPLIGKLLWVTRQEKFWFK